MADALRLAPRDIAYDASGSRQRADATHARATHPGVLALPVTFSIAEQTERGWRPQGSLRPTPHDARNVLYGALQETSPLLHMFDDGERAQFAQAAQEFWAVGDINEVRVNGGLLRICRVERMVRCGPDRPEPPCPSDHDADEPTKLHPTMDEDGTMHFDS